MTDDEENEIVNTALPTAARHSSESVEHYTPAAIVEAARETLGAIDLDPASCEEAQNVVGATHFFTRDDNGFRRSWEIARKSERDPSASRVFLNPPGGLSDNQERRVEMKCKQTGSCGLAPGHTHEGTESSAKKWWAKLAREYMEGRVSAAIFVAFSLEILQTTQVDAPEGLPIPLHFPICYPVRRVAYVKPGGKTGTAPPHASAIVLVCAPHEVDVMKRFKKAFAGIGYVVIPAPRTFCG